MLEQPFGHSDCMHIKSYSSGDQPEFRHWSSCWCVLIISSDRCAGLVEAMLGLQPNETREFVLAVPPGWGDIAEGASEAKIVVTLRELLEYIDLPEVHA